ncbi:hypothetical protein DF182_25230 [Chitinophaga flava]|uniref:ABC transporter permease n=2 Tax=Chitinophaga flava TaxID=2259036 RepID=A0A365XVP6_9BACT|nr:hypothetical protein DF182_25230 [Chitinophaga flava]
MWHQHIKLKKECRAGANPVIFEKIIIIIRYNVSDMFKDFARATFRNLWKEKFFTGINVMGLAIAIAACLLLFKYVYFEMSFDKFHINNNNIYRVTSLWNKGKVQEDHRALTVPWTGPGAKEIFPEIAEYGRLAPVKTFIGKEVISYEDKKISEDNVYFADPGFLKMFSFNMLRGSMANALSKPFTIVLTESLAMKYFKSLDDIVGKTLTIKTGGQLEQETFEVTGIIKDPPVNSHIQFNALLSFTSIFHGLNEGSTWWHWDYTYNYLLLRDGADPVHLGQKMSQERKRLFGAEMGNFSDEIEFVLQPLSAIHLGPDLKFGISKNTSRSALYFLILIGIFILIIGYINYINLAVAKSIERAKEIGVRKTLGAHRSGLIRQFLFESLFINVLAMLVALLLTTLLLPLFERFVEVHLSVAGHLSATVVFLLLLLIVGTFAAGLYPAFVLSSLKPIDALKDRAAKHMQGGGLRKVLVVGQFASAVLLICGTVTVFKQLHYMKNVELGMKMEKVVVMKGLGAFEENQYQYLKSELQKIPAIEKVAAASAVPGDELQAIRSKIIKVNGQKSNDIDIVLVDEDFFDALEIKRISGRGFNLASDQDASSVIVNESAAALMGYSDPGKALHANVQWDKGAFGHGGKTTRVVGVVSDYYQRAKKSQKTPVVYLPRKFFNPRWTNQYYLVKYQADNPASMLEVLKSRWQQAFGNVPFDYFFLEDHFNIQYKPEQLFGNVFSLFTFLALVIAALGLFALSSFTILQRSREIAIRKVMYASESDIVKLFLKDYLKLILVAYLVAMPVGFVLISKWLDDYANRITIGVWFYTVPALVIVLVALLSVSFQTWKAAVKRPILALTD